MIAIKFFKKTQRYVVCDGVNLEASQFNSDGTFSIADAGINVHQVSRRFETLEEAREAEKAYKEYVEKYK